MEIISSSRCSKYATIVQQLDIIEHLAKGVDYARNVTVNPQTEDSLYGILRNQVSDLKRACEKMLDLIDSDAK